MRVFFIFLCGYYLYAQDYWLYSEGYQEHYYYNRNIGFTFREYLLSVPTNLYLILLVVLFLIGMVFKKRFGWIAGAALIMDWLVQFIYNMIANEKGFGGIVIGAGILILPGGLLALLMNNFGIRRKHLYWSLGVAGIYIPIMIMEYSGFFIRPIPN